MASYFVSKGGQPEMRMDTDSAAAGQPLVNRMAKNSNHNDGRSLLKQTRQQPRARNASWISERRS